MCGRFTLRAGTSELRKAAAHGKNQKQDPQIVFQEKNLVEAPRKSRAKLPELLCYRPPPLKRRDRAFCLFRDTDVVVTSWTAARISWPRCRSPEHPKGGTGLLVCEELARAIGNEPAAAIVHWWGVSEVTVFRWRKAFGIGRSDPEGSRRLIQAAAQAGGEVIKEKEFTE
jgi:hypothetical protein